MSDDFLVLRLENWARCMRTSWTPDHCSSAEWRHVQHRSLTEGEEETRRRAKMPTDARDAALVELAWRKLDKDDRELLRGWYINRTPYKSLCRKLGLSSETVDGCFIYLVLAREKAHRNVARALDGLQDRVETPASIGPKQVERL